MDFLNNFWFWVALIAIMGMITAAISNAVDKSNKTKVKVAELQAGGDYRRLHEEAASLNAQVIDRLSAVEAKLAAVEKTLTDIP